MREIANTSRRGIQGRKIQDIPEFRGHLIRNGLTFDEWEKRNKSAMTSDGTGEALRLKMRTHKAKFR